MGKQYKNQNEKHRVWLAQNILSLLPKWGFEIDEEYTEDCWEFVLCRWDKFDIMKRTIVFTSIDKTSGAMRLRGKDAIRVISKRIQNNDEDKILYVRKVNRVGEFSSITKRIINCIN